MTTALQVVQIIFQSVAIIFMILGAYLMVSKIHLKKI